MFWDRVSGIYDLFGKIYNGKVNRGMCRIVAKEIGKGDRILECACGTGLITAAVAGKCRELVATDYSEGMLRQTRRKCGSYPSRLHEGPDPADRRPGALCSCSHHEIFLPDSFDRYLVMLYSFHEKTSENYQHADNVKRSGETVFRAAFILYTQSESEIFGKVNHTEQERRRD